MGNTHQDIVIAPPSYSKLVIWLHGLGGSATEWKSHLTSFGLQDTKIVLPNATPFRLRSMAAV